MDICPNCRLSLYLLFLIVLFGTTVPVFAHWKDHYRYSHELNRDSPARRRRQIPTQIDLNITVPFIFSARLYPYGKERKDSTLKPNATAQAVVLRSDLTYYQEKHPVVYILRDGAIAFDSDVSTPDRQSRFPRGPKVIAIYWAPVKMGDHGKVFFRETTDVNVLNLARSEVQIQYQYGDDFQPKSVLIVTWENVSPVDAPDDLPIDKRNTFQIAVIMSDNGTFAHVVYSKLKWNDNAVAGFNEGQGNGYFIFPGSGTPHSILLANESDIGIPGEWLFKIDDIRVFLCGPGFKGIECINKCDPGEWFYDCSRKCHCAPTVPPTDHAPCNIVNGHCANGKCRGGWRNPPVCDIDVDECEVEGAEALCPSAQPDCINTPGAYLCMCLNGYDNTTNRCIGSPDSDSRPDPGGVSVIPLQPRLVVNTPSRGLLPQRPRETQKPLVVVTPETIIPKLVAQPAVVTPKTIVPKLVAQWPPVQPAGPQPQPQTPASGLLTPVKPAVVVTNQQVPTEAQVVAADTKEPETFGFQEEQLVLSACPLQCGENAECKQRHDGGHLCVCNEGWSGDGVFCVDVNECFLENACTGNARCQNTLGSYTCECDDGFKSVEGECVDVNECEEGLAQCPGGNSSQCVNTIGSFQCACKPGFNGNPTSILGCIDINECLIPEFYCGPNADCKNTHGGFRCHCHDGYKRNSDSTGCVDIDECSYAPCDKAAVCHNTKGGYTCTCLQGYSGDGYICEETILFPFSRVDDRRLPRQKYSVVAVPLTIPIKIFDKEYNELYISSSGLVSFNEPMQTYKQDQLRNMEFVGLAPLYLNTDLTLGGSVYFKETNEFSTLKRATLNIQDDFNEPGFRAKTVVIVTFENVLPEGADINADVNTFQVVLISGDQGTYATFIYDQISDSSAQAALLNHDGNEVYELPGSGSVAHRLTGQSNIGQPGKWMFKIDEPTLIRCPSGVTGAPYCQEACQPGTWGKDCAQVCRCAAGIPCDFQTGFCANKLCQTGYSGPNCQKDIDECALGQHQCHPQAKCANVQGSYTCTCKEGFTGDGVSCFALDPCLVTFGTLCSVNAACRVSDQGQPSCVCLEGFTGDGHICEPAETTTTVEITTSTVSDAEIEATTQSYTKATTTLNPAIIPVRPGSVGSAKSTVEDKLRVATTAATRQTTTEEVTGRQTTSEQPDTTSFTWPTFDEIELVTATTRVPPFVINNRITPSPPRRRPGFGSGSGTTRQPVDGPDDIDSNIISAVGGGNYKYESASTSSMLVIIIPAVLCGVWLILIVVLLVVCLRRRKQKQREKYGLGYYHPPTSSKATSHPASSVNGAYTPSAYGSSWTIPRPTYDYYQGTYYPDPYSPYKYA